MTKEKERGREEKGEKKEEEKRREKGEKGRRGGEREIFIDHPMIACTWITLDVTGITL